LNNKLFKAVEEDYAHIKSKKERYKKMREDKYLNALQVKLAYAITCHKAQGGQWKHIYVDMGRIQKDEIDMSFMRWLYTAVTRATEKLYLIQFSDDYFK
jgi:exodeoxyribonuclease-5